MRMNGRSNCNPCSWLNIEALKDAFMGVGVPSPHQFSFHRAHSLDKHILKAETHTSTWRGGE